MVEEAERRDWRRGVLLIGLSAAAIAVGLLATALSARSLRPVRALIAGVGRIPARRLHRPAEHPRRRRDLPARVEFDAITRALEERELALARQQQALLRAERLAAVGRVSGAGRARGAKSSVLHRPQRGDAPGRAGPRPVRDRLRGGRGQGAAPGRHPRGRPADRDDRAVSPHGSLPCPLAGRRGRERHRGRGAGLRGRRAGPRRHPGGAAARPRAPAGAGGRGAAPAGAAQPGPERARGDGGRRHAPAVHLGRGRGGARPGGGHRARHPRGGPAPPLRPALHHQAPRHGARAGAEPARSSRPTGARSGASAPGRRAPSFTSGCHPPRRPRWGSSRPRTPEGPRRPVAVRERARAQGRCYPAPPQQVPRR